MRSSGDASAGKGLETSNMMEGKRVRDVREELWVPGEEEKRRKVECAAGGRARSRSLTETKRQSFSATECILYSVHDVSSDPPILLPLGCRKFSSPVDTARFTSG